MLFLFVVAFIKYFKGNLHLEEPPLPVCLRALCLVGRSAYHRHSAPHTLVTGEATVQVRSFPEVSHSRGWSIVPP